MWGDPPITYAQMRPLLDRAAIERMEAMLVYGHVHVGQLSGLMG